MCKKVWKVCLNAFKGLIADLIGLGAVQRFIEGLQDLHLPHTNEMRERFAVRKLIQRWKNLLRNLTSNERNTLLSQQQYARMTVSVGIQLAQTPHL